MAEYVLINEIRTWYDIQGEGEPLLMLHPGGVGVDSRAFTGSLNTLSSQFKVFLPERRGHGRTPDVGEDYTFELMADDTISFIEQIIGSSPIKILGMSDGAVVGLLVAKKRPDLVERLVCLAGVFNKEGWADAIQPTDEPPGFLIESYASISPDGREHYPVIHKKLISMHLNGPSLLPDDLKEIQCRTLVMIGDDDEVSLSHAAIFYQSIPTAELAVVPGTSHGLLIEKPELCGKIILDFLTKDAIDTLAPVRRATNYRFD